MSRLTRLAGLVCLVAALLMAASDLVGVTLDTSNLAATIASPGFTAFTVLKLVGTILLLLGLIGLYLHQSVAVEPFQFALNRSGIAELAVRGEAATADRPVGLVRVGSGGQRLSPAVVGACGVAVGVGGGGVQPGACR